MLDGRNWTGWNGASRRTTSDVRSWTFPCRSRMWWKWRIRTRRRMRRARRRKRASHPSVTHIVRIELPSDVVRHLDVDQVHRDTAGQSLHQATICLCFYCCLHQARPIYFIDLFSLLVIFVVVVNILIAQTTEERLYTGNIISKNWVINVDVHTGWDVSMSSWCCD